MALNNCGIPDFDCLGLHETKSYEEMAFNSDSGEIVDDDISPESDTTEEYSSSDDMIGSNNWSDESLEVDFSNNAGVDSTEQPYNTPVTFPGTVFETNSICEYNYEQLESVETRLSANNVESNVSPVFSNIPNLPTAGLFGHPSANSLHSATKYPPNSFYQSSSFSATNLPNFTEMHSDSSSNSLIDNASAEGNSMYTKEHSMPILEVITERFESLFTTDAAEKETGGSIRTRNNKTSLKSKRTRRKSKQ